MVTGLDSIKHQPRILTQSWSESTQTHTNTAVKNKKNNKSRNQIKIGTSEQMLLAQLFKLTKK